MSRPAPARAGSHVGISTNLAARSVFDLAGSSATTAASDDDEPAAAAPAEATTNTTTAGADKPSKARRTPPLDLAAVVIRKGVPIPAKTGPGSGNRMAARP